MEACQEQLNSILRYVEEEKLIAPEYISSHADDEFFKWMKESCDVESESFEKSLANSANVSDLEGRQEVPLWLFSTNLSVYTREIAHSYVLLHMKRFVLGVREDDGAVINEWDSDHPAYLRILSNSKDDGYNEPKVAVLKGGQRIFSLFFYTLLCYKLELKLLPHLASLIGRIPGKIVPDKGLVSNTFQALGKK